MDEFEAVRQLLAERPPPAADVVATARASLEQAVAAPAHTRAPLHLNGGRHVLDGDPAPPRRWRRWRGWLVPAAAAAAVATVVAVSLAVSNTVGFRQAGAPPPPATPAAFAQVTRYFVTLTGRALPDQGQYAEVVATATGAVLGRVTTPQPHTVFTEVAAAADDRTFVLAAQHGQPVTYVNGRHKPLMYQGVGPAKFYKLVIGRSGRPASLAALPVPPVTGNVNGFALSPDGSKLAVSVLPPTWLRPGRPAPPPRGSRLLVFTVATGAERDWTLPGIGWIGMNKPNAGSLSWAGDNRTLLFQAQLGTGGGTAQARLLDTATPGGSVLAASRRVPFSTKQLSGIGGGFMILSADGTKIVGTISTGTMHIPAKAHSPRARLLQEKITRLNAAYHKDLHQHPWPATVTQQAEHRVLQAMQAYRREFGPSHSTRLAISELSVATGKPMAVLGRLHGQGAGNTWADVVWASPDVTAMIIDGAWPENGGSWPMSSQGPPVPVVGVMTGGSFTPFPPQVQALLSRGQGTW